MGVGIVELEAAVVTIDEEVDSCGAATEGVDLRAATGLTIGLAATLTFVTTLTFFPTNRSTFASSPRSRVKIFRPLIALGAAEGVGAPREGVETVSIPPPAIFEYPLPLIERTPAAKCASSSSPGKTSSRFFCSRSSRNRATRACSCVVMRSRFSSSCETNELTRVGERRGKS